MSNQRKKSNGQIVNYGLHRGLEGKKHESKEVSRIKGTALHSLERKKLQNMGQGSNYTHLTTVYSFPFQQGISVAKMCVLPTFWPHCWGIEAFPIASLLDYRPSQSRKLALLKLNTNGHVQQPQAEVHL